MNRGQAAYSAFDHSRMPQDRAGTISQNVAGTGTRGSEKAATHAIDAAKTCDLPCGVDGPRLNQKEPARQWICRAYQGTEAGSM